VPPLKIDINPGSFDGFEPAEGCTSSKAIKQADSLYPTIPELALEQNAAVVEYG
jgi:hypothetical protein